MESIEKQQFVNPVMLKEHFWNMFVADAFLGNFDRHNGNWGFLYDPVSQNAEIAPVFDCGSCLLPQADEAVMERVLRDENEMNARIFQFPTSAVKEQGRKIHYYDFLMEGQHEECNEALLRIVPRIQMDMIRNFLKGAIPKEQLKQAYVPDVYGKERRKRGRVKRESLVWKG